MLKSLDMIEPQRKDAARLWVFIARAAPVAVILRRGPSKQVQLIQWNLQHDTFESGQWFKGRIEEQFADLSPNGELFVYSARKEKAPTPEWSAISRPPWFTALTWWPIGGGGQFVSDTELILNHYSHAAAFAPGAALGSVRIAGYAESYGKRDPEDVIRERDGWTLVQRGHFSPHLGKRDRPEILTKKQPRESLTLEWQIVAREGRNNEQRRYRVAGPQGEGLPQMDADWADWDPRGDLLYARNGRLFRCRTRQGRLAEPEELVDLNGRKFEAVAAPSWATRW